MLAFLKGAIQSREFSGGASEKLVIDVSGIGLEVIVPQRALLSCGPAGSEICLHTYLVIRENEWTIYGFNAAAERELFALLQTVSGIGPKAALALISTFNAQELARAIADGEHKLISQAPGIGTKTAQRLCLELKSKIEPWLSNQSAALSASTNNAATDEVRSILEGLGYTPTEIARALQSAGAKDEDVESLVRASLRILGAAAAH